MTAMPDVGPDTTVSARDALGIDSDIRVPSFSNSSEHVPEVDDAYRFDRDVSLAILAGFAQNRRVLVQGFHGTGKSTHCLLYTSPSPRDKRQSRMPSSA